VLLTDLNILKELTKNGNPKGEARDQAINLMRKLRAKGFTNKEIAELIEPAWSQPTVKKHTRGVEVKDLKEKNSLMKTLAAFVESGQKISDLEEYTKIRELVPTKALTFRQISDLYTDLTKWRIPPIIALDMVKVLMNHGFTPEKLEQLLRDWYSLQQNGFTLGVMSQLAVIVEKHGLKETVNAIKSYQESRHLEELCKIKEERAERLENEIEKLKIELDKLGLYKDYTFRLLTSGFDQHSLHLLTSLVEKYGKTGEILEAFNSYINLKSIEKEKEELTSRTEEMREEFQALESSINSRMERLERINQRIGYIVSEYEKLVRLARIHDLITGKDTKEMLPFELKNILTLLLYGSLKKITDKPALYKSWQSIKPQLENLLTLAERIEVQ
jgi:hypothetical protein